MGENLSVQQAFIWLVTVRCSQPENPRSALAVVGWVFTQSLKVQSPPWGSMRSEPTRSDYSLRSSHSMLETAVPCWKQPCHTGLDQHQGFSSYRFLMNQAVNFEVAAAEFRLHILCWAEPEQSQLYHVAKLFCSQWTSIPAWRKSAR